MAALVAPPFIDWSRHRDWLEARIGQALDARVDIEGAADVRLLPAPRLRVGQLRLSRPGVTLGAREAAFELSPTDLLRGRIHFVEARFVSAAIAVDPAAVVAPAADAGRVAVERLVVRDGALAIAGATPIALAGLDLDARAESLAGPFKGEGALRAAAGARAFQFTTGAIEDGTLRAKFALDAGPEAPQLDLEGTLRWADGAPAFEGAGAASGVVDAFALKPAPWRATFSGRATPGGFAADRIELRLGDDDHLLGASGAGEYAAARGANLRLSSRMLDIDRFLSAYGPLTRAPAASTRLSLELSADSATLGAETIAEPVVRLEAGDGAPRVRASAALPGRTRLAYDGALDPARDFALAGRIDTQTRDARALGRWLEPFAPSLARVLVRAPSGPLALSGDLATTAQGGALRAARATLDRSRFEVEAEWRPAADGARARIAAKIHSPALDIDSLPDLAALQDVSQDVAKVDFKLDFTAQAVRVARVGAASADAGRIVARLARTGETIALEHLAIENLGGAALTGAGTFGPSGARAEGRLDAARLADLAALARRVWPGRLTDAFVARAFALSPARLAFRLEGDAAAARLAVQGEAGGARLDLSVAPGENGAPAALRGRIEAPDAAILLRQAGVPVIPLKGLGAGRADMQATRGREGAWATRASIALAGLKADFAGDVRVVDDGLSGEGGFNASAGDLTPVMQILALGAPHGAVPLSASGRVTFAPSQIAIAGLGADIAGAAIKGGLTRTAGDIWRGDLAFDRLSAPFLASLVLGPSQPVRAGAVWSELKFAPQTIDPPDADIVVAVARLAVGAGEATNARAGLRLGPGLVEARDVTASYGGAQIAGALALRRDGALASLRARVETGALDFAAPPFSLSAEVRMEAAGAGASMAELVGSLGGAGRLSIAQAAIARAAPQALARTLADIESEDATFEPARVARALERGFDAGAQMIGANAADIGLAAGRLSLAPLALRFGAAQARISGALDLRALSLDIREQIETDPPRDWEGAAPAVALSWRGPLGASVRAIEAEPLIAALVQRAIARESARNAALEADIRERAFFNRRLKFDRRLEEERREEIRREEARLRAEELKREEERAAEQARLRAEEARREETRRRAEDARREEARRKAEERNAEEPERPRDRAGDRPIEKPPAAFLPAGRDVAPDPSTAGRY